MKFFWKVWVGCSLRSHERDINLDFAGNWAMIGSDYCIGVSLRVHRVLDLYRYLFPV